jgi:hypothetical protein
MNNGIDVFINDRYSIDGVGIYIVRGEGEIRHLMKFNGDMVEWVVVEDTVLPSPTFHINNGIGRAMLDALTRHYQGASDMHNVRSDYLHERGRVDKCIDALLKNNASLADIADKLTET